MEETLKKTLRPKVANRLIWFAILYITVIELIFPLFQYVGSHEANPMTLGLILAQPCLYVFGRSVEKVKGNEA